MQRRFAVRRGLRLARWSCDLLRGCVPSVGQAAQKHDFRCQHSVAARRRDPSCSQRLVYRRCYAGEYGHKVPCGAPHLCFEQSLK